MTEPPRDDPATTIVRAIGEQVWHRDVDPKGERGLPAWDLLAQAHRDSGAALAEMRAMRLELQALRIVIGALAGAIRTGDPVDAGALLAEVDDSLASTRASIRDSHTK